MLKKNEFDKEDHFNDINNRLDKYNSQIEKFKKAIFNMIKKQGNFKEVEKQIKTYENKNKKMQKDYLSKKTK